MGYANATTFPRLLGALSNNNNRGACVVPSVLPRRR